MQITKASFSTRKITLLVAIFLIVFVVVSSLFYGKALGKMPDAPIIFSMLFAWVSILSVIGMISWLMAVVYFIKMVLSQKKGAFLGDAPPLNSLYALSDKYLSEEGMLARGRLLIGVIVGMSAFIGVAAAIFVLRLYYQS